MCNGDLGMYRVMPWAYPTISGGSSGGTTVDPTPTPTPTPDPKEPYDLSNYSISFVSNSTKSVAVPGGVNFYFGLSRSGAVEVDTSNVSSIKVTFGSGNMILSSGATVSLTNLFDSGRVNKFSLSDLNSSSSKYTAYLKASVTTSLRDLTVTGFSEGSTMIVNIYDSAGNVLQTKEVVIT